MHPPIQTESRVKPHVAPKAGSDGAEKRQDWYQTKLDDIQFAPTDEAIQSAFEPKGKYEIRNQTRQTIWMIDETRVKNVDPSYR